MVDKRKSKVPNQGKVPASIVKKIALASSSDWPERPDFDRAIVPILVRSTSLKERQRRIKES
jgi:hypothetical protein